MSNNPFTTFYIVRHAESESNVKRIIQGQGKYNPSLTENGSKQAAKLAESLKHLHFDAVVSSDTPRALQTAEIMGNIFNLEVQVSPLIRERSFGKYEGMKVEDFLKLYKDWESLTHEEKFNYKLDNNEESFLEAYIRFTTALTDLTTKYHGKTLLLVTHGLIIRGFLIKNQYGDFKTVGGIENCGYIVIESNNGNYTIKEAHGLKSWDEMNAGLNIKS